MLITVDEFRTIDEPPGAYHELRHGAVYEVPWPRYRYVRLRSDLQDRITRLAGTRSVCHSVLPFRPLPEHELWVADVGYLNRQRHKQARIDDEVHGSPDLMIELFYADAQRQPTARAGFFLTTGCHEFWLVKPTARLVTVHTTEGVREYSPGESVPVDRFFPEQPPIPVSSIFREP